MLSWALRRSLRLYCFRWSSVPQSRFAASVHTRVRGSKAGHSSSMAAIIASTCAHRLSEFLMK